MKRISAQHHSVKQPRLGGRFVKQRTNGKHKIKGATVNVPIGGIQRIVRPQARYNWLMPNVGSITPQFIEMTLNGALAGNHVQQWSLFDLMLRTWPELRSCYSELITSVLRKTIVFEPFHEEDEQPTPDAIEKSKLVSAALRKMESDSQNDGNDFEGTIKDLLDAWFRGYAVSEIVWHTIEDAQLSIIQVPRTTFWVDPVNYAFDVNSSIGLIPQMKSQGGYYPFATTATQDQMRQTTPSLIPFPDYKFLVGICKSKAGSPLAGAMMVPLAWWWCAANFSSDWLLNLAQVFGLPFRWANYEVNAAPETINAICNMLQNMGSAGWAAFPVGTTLELHQPSQTGSDHSPQGELLDRADRYCRTLILGQTMTGTHGTTGKGGGQAFGKVEEDVKADRIDAAGKFVMSVINRQLIPSILALNYGDTDEAPEAKFLEDEVADFTEAQRDQVLVNAGLPIGVDYMRKKYDIPEPAKDEKTLTKPEPKQPFGSRSQNQNPTDTNAPNDGQDPAKASDQPGHPFRGNQYVHIGDEVNTPLGRGIVVANTPQYALVSLHGGGSIRRINHSDITRIPRDKSNFPAITHSAEDERRHALNTKLEQLNAIEDDAVFAQELKQLASQS